MKTKIRASAFWSQLVLILLCLMPLVILFFLPGGGLVSGALWFWLVLMLSLLGIWLLFGTSSIARGEIPEPELRLLYPEEQPAVIREVMNVRIATEEEGTSIFRGRLRESAESVYDKLREAFALQTVPLLQEDEKFGAAVVLVPKPVEQATMARPVRPWIHWLLFGLTVLTTTWAGAAHQGVDLLAEPARFPVGLPYALGLLAILGVHEMGHYFMALRHGIRVTPPYFIPVPFALGTFGAFIQMRSPTENRRALFEVAVAGPLAGLVIAIPALLIGLQSSLVSAGAAIGGDETTTPRFISGTSAGSSLLFVVLAKLALPGALQQGCVVQLSPLAFAGWLGLIVTALNLLPIGQLDGGHMARAMFGTRTGSVISSIAMWSLLLLAIFVWRGLLTWAIIVFFIAGTPAVPPLNDLTPLSPGRRWLGYATFAILVTLVPLPQALLSAAGVHCPYL